MLINADPGADHTPAVEDMPIVRVVSALYHLTAYFVLFASGLSFFLVPFCRCLSMQGHICLHQYLYCRNCFACPTLQ